MFCKNCRRHYNENDPEYLRWMDADSGYCDAGCENKGEFIAQYGEQAYREQIEMGEELEP
jgi:transcription elongation factor Elf1